MDNLYKGPEIKPGYLGKGTIVYEPISPLSLTQRLGRLRYACYQFCSSLIAILLMALSWVVSASPAVPAWLGYLATGVVALLAIVYLTGLMVRRLHDIVRSGWWTLLVLVPGINLPFQLYLYLADGSSMMNRYGTPNPPPGALVKVFGGLFWVWNVLVLTFLTALVFLQWWQPDWIAGALERLPLGSIPRLPVGQQYH